jgi:hyperosmotically inducible periplasmic protein
MRTPIIAAGLITAAALAGCEKQHEVTFKTPTPQSVERTVEKAGVALDDATVTAKVKTALIAEPGLKGLAIDVDTTQNVVTLSGSVATETAKQEAERVARGIEGVKDVTNNLSVKAAS